jgi:hypothetical protein
VGLSITKLFGEVNLTVACEGGTLEFTHCPAGFSCEFQEQIQAIEDEGGERAAIGHLCAALPSLVPSWNLADDTGAPLPLTEETFRRLPVKLVISMLQAIAGAHNPNATTPTANTGSF